MLRLLKDLEVNPRAFKYGEEEYDLAGYRAVLEQLGLLPSPLPFLHIAGTKGKGSTAAIAEGMLRGLGYETALYSSPHLDHYGERFRINGQPWSQAEFEQRLEAFGRFVEQRAGVIPFKTVFEALTALALFEFGKMKSGKLVVLWETGLGGRLDCTNVVNPLVTVITAIGLDHVHLLGGTIEAITCEKAGIIKPGAPLVVSAQAPEFHDTVTLLLNRKAAEAGAKYWSATSLAVVKQRNGSAVEAEIYGRPVSGELPLLGGFQARNLEAATAAVILAVEKLTGELPSAQKLAQGWPLASWPGRLELVRGPGGETLILDGAHCPLSARALGQSLAELNPSPATLLFSMNKDKDAEKFLRNLIEPLEDGQLFEAICFPLGGVRSAQPADLLAACKGMNLPARGAESAEQAARMARSRGRPALCTGSLYPLGRVRRAWQADD